MINSKYCLYSQWFKGKQNEVSDSLSHNHHLSDTYLTFLITSAFPLQLLNMLLIKPLLSKIISWLTLLLQKQTEKNMQSPKRPQRSSLGHGIATLNTVTQLESVTSFLATCWEKINNITSRVVSYKQCEKQGSVMSNSVNWPNPPSTLLWTTWLRPFGLMASLIQDMTKIENWLTFFNANSKSTGTLSLPRNCRRL